MPDSIQQRLREDRLLNPDYATRLEAATLLDQAVEALTEARAYLAAHHKYGSPVLAKIDATLVSICGVEK